MKGASVEGDADVAPARLGSFAALDCPGRSPATREGSKVLSAPLRVPLVGRAAELAAARGAVSSARQHRGKLLFVHGEAGIGKTRLCEELRATQEPRQTQVLTGRADPGDDATTFSALADSLRAARRSEPTLWTAVQERRATLAAVVPELVGGPGRSPGTQRPVLFEALLEVIEDAAGDRATLWILEDLHWADPSTWEFVVYATRRVGAMALALLVTFRDEELPHEQRWLQRLPTLRREPDVVTIALDRLDQAEARALVRALDPGLPAGAVARLADRSAGTPLLAEELVGTFAHHPDAVPDVIQMTVRERTRRVDAATRTVLEAVAVGGPQLDVGLLLRILPEDPSAALERLTQTGLLVADAGGQAVCFRHPLLWEAAYRDVPLARRRQLHARFGALFEETFPTRPERAARHHELADDPEASLRALLRARDRVDGNVGRAASLALSALNLAERHDRLRSHRSELTRVATQDLFLAGRWTELEPLVSAQWVRRHHLPEAERAWLANVMVLDLFFLGAVARARAIAEEETARLEAAGRLEGSGLLFAQAGYLAWFDGEAAAAVRLARRARELADATDHGQVEVRARMVEVLARHRLDRRRERAIAEHRATAELAHRAGLSSPEANVRYAVAVTSTRLEDYEAAERAGAAAGTFYMLVARVLQALVHTLEGRPDAAEALLTRSGTALRHGVPLFAVVVDTIAAHLSLHRGELDHARALLSAPSAETEPARGPPYRAAHCGARGWLAWEEGQWEQAAADLACSQQAVLVSAYIGLETGPLLLPLHVDALVRLGRRDDAERAFELGARTYQEPDRFFAAALCAAQLRLTPSPATGRDATRQAQAAPWPWLEGLVGCWRGELLGDVEAAVAASGRFQAIGAPRGTERAQGVLRRLGVPVRRARRSSGALSARELEIAQLVAQGLSNSAIAARLFVTRATVASHVTHILTKLGYSSRSQIAAWVAQQARPS
jgi:DNA-binding CsgD family transcriptional regulator